MPEEKNQDNQDKRATQSVEVAQVTPKLVIDDYDNGYNQLLQGALDNKLSRTRSYNGLVRMLRKLTKVPGEPNAKTEYVRSQAVRYLMALNSARIGMLQEISANLVSLDDTTIRDLIAQKMNDSLKPDLNSKIHDNIGLNILSEALFKLIKKQIATANKNTETKDESKKQDEKIDDLLERMLNRK